MAINSYNFCFYVYKKTYYSGNIAAHIEINQQIASSLAYYVESIITENHFKLKI